jgi:membrane-bound metal-dependent hydrolase YbcI (DUF457 family)
MLPDIIDKPLGLMLFGSPNMGRTIAHTLLFLIFLFLLHWNSLYMSLISLTWGVLCHLCLDYMWNSPKILLWPLLGPFPSAPLLDTMSYLEMLLSGLRNLGVLIPEIAGFVYLAYFACTRRKVVFSWVGRVLRGDCHLT